MFETSSALFSIADDGEFRFARFYIVCEAVPLGTLGNPLIVCGLSDTFRGVSKRGRDTESDAKNRQEEMQCHLDKDDITIRISFTASKHFVYSLFSIFKSIKRNNFV